MEKDGGRGGRKEEGGRRKAETETAFAVRVSLDAQTTVLNHVLSQALSSPNTRSPLRPATFMYSTSY